ncbi:Type 1 glutamine amidotransferase-like domain-containing protein [Gemmatimonas sp.]|uniref:cyanophycinase n=1 Tax=Gemmatimonas sp. TaxID=1962908 RepID=UPI00286D7DE3|nr:Type 1 glutamine amidotransferase-like domain-containing protein [Gemmatimonas sp.]
MSASSCVVHGREVAVLLLASSIALGCAGTGGATGGSASTASSRGTPSVGPRTGSVMVVGGGQQGPEVFAKFIELAGGPDALIVDVPTAGGDSIDTSDGGRGLKAAGARNVVVYHTTSRTAADADSFVAKIANARGVWFGGGRHYRLVNSYAGTKSERAFQAVLDRGGVVGGSSAGASILGDYLVRGAPSNDNRIFNHPQFLKGFAYLRGVAIDQHVVARERLPDLHDSLTSRRPDLLGISEDEGTVWVVRGDSAEIIGRNKAFVYNGRDANDAGKPFLTLRPGDRYNLATRRVVSRAIDATPLTQKFVDNVFASYGDIASGGAAVLVAQDGKVLANRAYGVAMQRRFTPETGAPNFALGGLSAVLNAALAPDSTGRISAASVRRVTGMGGTQRLAYDSATKLWTGNVDDLYRFDQARLAQSTEPKGFWLDTQRGDVMQVVYGISEGRRSAWVRYPGRKTTIIILTNDDRFDAMAAAGRIADRLLAR